MRRALALLALSALAPLPASAQRVSTSAPPRTTSGFQEPTAERTVTPSAQESEPTATSRRASTDDESTESLEESLYLRERPDALGEAAHEWQDAEIERLLAEG